MKKTHRFVLPGGALLLALSFAPCATAAETGIDPTADPCKDFYQYACGTWLKANPIPPEFSAWGRFNELTDKNRETLRTILEAASQETPARDEARRKSGDYYASCMDEARAEREGMKPIEPDLARIAALPDAASAFVEAGRLRRRGVGALFVFESAPDARKASEVIAQTTQGGLGLPDRDYYTKDDEKMKKLRGEYVEHLTKMFALAGDSDAAAAAEAARVMSFETALAKGSLLRVELRDPEKLYNRKSLAALQTFAPSLPWTRYFAEVGVPGVSSVNVASVGYVTAVDGLAKTAALDDWKSYLRWTVIKSAAPRLSSAFVDENFRFSGTILTGAKALQPRWKRCVSAAEAGLRDLVGKPYADATFGEEGKKRIDAMVAALQAAMDADLAKVAWMDAPTRKKAREKLAAFGVKVGVPKTWADMSKLEITRGSWEENDLAVKAFHFDRDLAKIGKPRDLSEWEVTVPTVNAGYSPEKNDITFPAGILQPPFFDRDRDEARNYGAIGGGIGHEITHGFDDEGSKYDKVGNLANWWTERSLKEFQKRTACVEKQFSEYAVFDDLNVNGKLTLGENVADLGGLRIAYAALGKSGASKGAKIDGLSRDQRFFLGWAQVWCSGDRPEALRLRVKTNEHSPSKFRVNGPLSDLKEFKAAFSCPDDAPMVRKVAEACEVW